uniref:Spiroplasma plectrovirus-related protein n=1 Tax=Strongyloides stercoralis TaxID=6248 RepID=A0A0K0E4I5_STRER
MTGGWDLLEYKSGRWSLFKDYSLYRKGIQWIQELRWMQYSIFIIIYYLFIVFCIVVFFSISLWILGFSLVFNDFSGFLLVFARNTAIRCVLSISKCSGTSEYIKYM